MKVYACVEWDEINQTCSAHAYVDAPTMLPTLSGADGHAIGWKLVLLFVAVRVVKMLRHAITDRIG